MGFCAALERSCAERTLRSLKQEAGRLTENDLAGVDDLLQSKPSPPPQIAPAVTPAAQVEVPQP